MIPQAIGIINGKGGTLKTSVTATCGGILAAAGYRVLLVDVDPQGNLLRDLGLHGGPHDDQGAALAAALTGRGPLRPIPTGRNRLDLAVGGDVLEDVAVEPGDIDAALESAVDDYDLVILDCPPGNRALQIAALTASRFVVIPTRADTASLDGLRRVARLFAEIRAGANPDLELLGVVLADIGSQSRRILRDTREQVAALFGDEDAMLLSTIRHAEAPATDARRLGRLVHELDREFYATLPTGSGRFAASAPGLVGDYQRLTAELAERITQRAGATL